MNKKITEEKTIGIFGICGLILFYLSFIPYLLLIWSSVMGVNTFFGGDSFNRYEYGFKAVAYMGMCLTCIIPVIPVCLLYQILFGILYIRKRPSEIRRPALIYSAAFAALILLPCLFYSGREFIYYERSVPEIRSFLSEKYGENVSRACKIKLDDMNDEEFDVYSPVLSADNFFTVSRGRDGGFDDHDNLIKGFVNENIGFSEDLNSFLDDKYDLPENMHFEARCTNADLDCFEYGDDYSAIIPTAEYSIDRILVDLEMVNQETLEKTLTDIWKVQCPKFEDSLGDSLVVIVLVDGEAVANMQITMPIPANHNLPVGSIGVLDIGETKYGLLDEAFYL